jgi:hypothetical protein
LYDYETTGDETNLAREKLPPTSALYITKSGPVTVKFESKYRGLIGRATNNLPPFILGLGVWWAEIRVHLATCKVNAIGVLRNYMRRLAYAGREQFGVWGEFGSSNLD